MIRINRRRQIFVEFDLDPCPPGWKPRVSLPLHQYLILAHGAGNLAVLTERLALLAAPAPAAEKKAA